MKGDTFRRGLDIAKKQGWTQKKIADAIGETREYMVITNLFDHG